MIYKRKKETQAEYIRRIVNEAIAAGATSADQVSAFASDHVGLQPVIDFFNEALLETYQQIRKGGHQK